MREQSQTTARAFWTIGPGRGEIRTESLAGPGPGEVLVETRFSGISRGTESLVLAGGVPPSEYARMRAPFQRGDFPFPVCYGYACVGTVTGGEAALVGRDVFCLHPHQDRFVVPADAVVALPDDVPPERAVLAANAETALNAIWDAAPGPCDRIAVIGGGVIGLLVGALAAALPGCRPVLVDVDDTRRAPAEALGLAFALPADAPADRDVVFHASAQADGLATALDCAGRDATVVELSWFGDRDVAVPLGRAFHARRLTLKSSQVGHLPPARTARWTRRRRLAAAVSLLADPRFDVLLGGDSPFERLPEVLPELASAGGGPPCHRIRY
jgi:threonine dehydrogenase-like Zn-dependent dehydrogenase